MFIGHYGVSFALKRAEPRLSLGILFLAVQGLDVLFGGFVLAGVEKMRIVPGFTAYNPYDLYFMPYSHSLVGAAAWSLLAFGAFLALRRRPLAGAALVAAAVFSHFVLDVPVHTPDLPLLGAGSPKIGLGLWNHRWAALGLELLCLGAGLLLYLRATRAARPGARWVTGAAVGILVLAAVATPFLPPPPSGAAFAVRALAAYALLAVLGEWLDRSRTPAAGRMAWTFSRTAAGELLVGHPGGTREAWRGRPAGRRVEAVAAAETGERCAVLAVLDTTVKNDRNLCCVDQRGRVLWTAATPDPSGPDYYVSLRVEGERLIAYSFSGYRVEIDWENGALLHSEFVK